MTRSHCLVTFHSLTSTMQTPGVRELTFKWSILLTLPRVLILNSPGWISLVRGATAPAQAKSHRSSNSAAGLAPVDALAQPIATTTIKIAFTSVLEQTAPVRPCSTLLICNVRWASPSSTAVKSAETRAAAIDGPAHVANLGFLANTVPNPAEDSGAHFVFEDSPRSCSVWSRKFRVTRKFFFVRFSCCF